MHYVRCLWIITLGTFILGRPSILNAQEKSPLIYLQLKNQSLKQAFELLEERYALVFAYDVKLVENIKVSSEIKGLELDQALDQLLTFTPLTYKKIDLNHILIKRANKPKAFSEETEFRWVGKVVDGESGRELPFARMVKSSDGKGVISDKDGYFVWNGQITEDDSIQINYLGYQAKLILGKELLKPNADYQEIHLIPSPHVLEDVLIVKKIDPIIVESSGDRMTLNPRRLQALPGWGEPDIFRMVQLLPGVSSNGESASGMNIRGGTPDQNLILWDGIPVYHTGHFFGLFSAFNPYLVKDLDVYTNGFSARYGGRVSSVIDIRSLPDSADDGRFGLGVNLLSAHAYAEIPIFNRKGAISISYRRAFSDIISSDFYQKWSDFLFKPGKINEQANDGEDYPDWANFSARPTFFFTDFNSKWVWDPNDKDRFAVSFYQGSDQLDYVYQVETPFEWEIQNTDRLKQGNWGLSASWKHLFKENYESSLEWVYSQYESDLFTNFGFLTPDGERDGFFKQANQLEDFTLRWDNIIELNPQHNLNWGLHFFDMKTNYSFEARENEEYWLESEDYRGRNLSAYIDNQVRLEKGLYLGTGLRFNHFQGKQLQKNFLEPRVSLQWHWNQHWSLKGAWGYYQQFSNQVFVRNELKLGNDFWLLTDREGLPVLSASNWSIGLQYVKDGLQLEAELYGKRIEGLISASIKYSKELKYPKEIPFDHGRGLIKGLELSAQKKWARHTAWLNYTFGEVNYQFNELGRGELFPADHDQPHMFKATYLYSHKSWDFSFSYLARSGRPFTPANGVRAALSDDPARRVAYWYVNLGRYNSERLPDYSRMDIAATYSFHLGANRGVLGKTGVSVYNLLNATNIQDKQYRIDYSQSDQGRAELITIDRLAPGFTPNIFLRFEW